MTVYTRHIFYGTNIPVLLPAGTNCIAVEVHLSSLTNSAMGFDLELIGTGCLDCPPPPPSLSIARAAGNTLSLSWSLAYGTNFSLYSTTNPSATGNWSQTTASLHTNSGQITITQSVDSSAKFFRLQSP
jgi:hypothetical protein